MYAPIAIVILALFSYGFYYFVGYETTAVTSPKLQPTLPVYVPQTATPLPTPTSTPTPLPTATPAPVTESSSSAPATEIPAAASVTWDTDIAPLFTQKCLMCHGATASGGLNLSTYADAMKGGISGPAFIAGDSGNSPMIAKFEGGKHTYAALTAEEIALINSWLNSGALEK
jgi:mono/diheme cytochrome c family protein